MKDEFALTAVKALHTVIWAFFVACIVGAPIAAALGSFRLAALLIAFVSLEAVVLALNRWTCPLTGIASRYTARRDDNFDIYLPLWLAKYNKQIFSPLFILGVLYTAVEWYRQGAGPR